MIRGEPFRFCFILRFDAIQKILSLKDIEEKVDDYAASLLRKDNDVIKDQIEFLKHKISMNESRIMSGYNKTNLYTAIGLVYLGFVVYLFVQVFGFAQVFGFSQPPILAGETLFKYPIYILTGLSAYYIFSCFLFIQFALSIKGHIRSAFRDVRNNSCIRNLARAYYTDWYSTKNESDVITSIVANIQKYFIRSLLMFASIWFLLILKASLDTLAKPMAIPEKEHLAFDYAGQFQECEYDDLMSITDSNSDELFVTGNTRNKGGMSASNFLGSVAPERGQVIKIVTK